MNSKYNMPLVHTHAPKKLSKKIAQEKTMCHPNAVKFGTQI